MSSSATSGSTTPDPVAKITEVIGDDRLRVGQDNGLQSLVLQRSSGIAKETLKAGDEVRVDPNYRMALELLKRPKSEDHYLDVVPELPWEKVGGQQEALQAIKDAIELPLIHADLFAKFNHTTPKGFLLYGPPGCGKTLIGKATAYNLTAQLEKKTGEKMKEYFMHIKGPEILNMWVGESERMVREIFATAREKRKEGFLPFLFIDEAESILGTRRASRFSNILSTLVPMFCTEMDGIDSLNDVVIILASNRADLIDPAIIRPGRIDRKIKVNRPTKDGAREIYKIYLAEGLPYDPAMVKEAGSVRAAIDKLVDGLIDQQFTHRDENRFLEVTLRSGRKETLYRGDLISGAIIASIVERAKGSGDQTRHRHDAGGGHQRQRPEPVAQRRVRGERHLPAHGHHRGLVEADRLRIRKRRPCLPRARQFARRPASQGQPRRHLKTSSMTRLPLAGGTQPSLRVKQTRRRDEPRFWDRNGIRDHRGRGRQRGRGQRVHRTRPPLHRARQPDEVGLFPRRPHQDARGRRSARRSCSRTPTNRPISRSTRTGR